MRLELADLGLSRHAPGDVLVDLTVGIGFEGQDVAEVVLTNVPQLRVVGDGEGADNAAHFQGRQGDGGGGGCEGRGWCGGGAGCRGGSGCAGGRWGWTRGRRAGRQEYCKAKEDEKFLDHRVKFARIMPKKRIFKV